MSQEHTFGWGLARDQSWDQMARCRHEIEYVTTEDESSHESWLFEWVLDCLETEEVIAVSLEREGDQLLTVSIRIFTLTECGPENLDERLRTQLTKLTERVDWVLTECSESESMDHS